MKRIGTIGLVAVLAAAIVAPSPVFAEDTAASGTVTYKAGTGYDFEKLSHPTVGTSQPDGIVDYLGNGEVAVPGDSDNTANNEGDRGQSYSWSAVSYGDWLYVGTCYAAMGNTLTLMKSTLGDSFDADTMEASLKAMFNGTFFYGQDDGANSGGILVKVNTKTGETKLLMSKSKNGISALFRNAVSYNGKLYFCGSVNGGGGGLPSVYEIDPKNDDAIKVVYQGLSNMKDYGAAYKQGISTGIRGMCVYDGQLVISNVGKDASGKFVATILTSSDPSQGFTQIASSEDLFNYPALRYKDSIYGGAIWDMVEYNGHLYVSICTGTPENAPDSNTMQSFALVRGDKNDDGSWSWTSVAGDQSDSVNSRYPFGLDSQRTRSGAANLCVYNGYLYIGEYNDEEIALERILFNKAEDGSGTMTSGMGGVDCSFVNANLEQSVNLYRMDKNEDVQLVVGDHSDTFGDPISGIGSGFGHNENQYIWRMQVFDGKLYLGTFDTSSLLEPIGQFSNGDILAMTPEQWKSQISYIRDLIKQLLKKKPVVDSKAAYASESSDANEAQLSDGFDGLNDALDDTTDLLGDQVSTLSGDTDDDAAYTEKIESETQYFQSFADAYSAALDEYQNLEAQYEKVYGTELPSEIKDAYGKLLNSDILTKIKSVITCLGYLKNAERGFDMYVTDDGVNFTTLTTSGFNDPYNHGLRVFAVTNQGLCLGTANPFYGTQLWIQRKEVSTDPSEPTGPTDPSEPSEPSDPSKPSDPQQPEQPSDPSSPSTPQTPSTGSETSTVSKTTVSSTKASKKTKGGLAETGDKTAAIVAVVAVAGIAALLGGAFSLTRRNANR